MTKDGKVGFFPSSHTKPESIQEAGESPDSGGGHRKYISSRFFSIRRSGGV